MTIECQIGNESGTTLPKGYAIFVRKKQISSQMFFPQGIKP